MFSPNFVALKHEGQFGDEEFVALWNELTNHAQEAYRLEMQASDEMYELEQQDFDS
jgi:hypothetical protein